MKKEMPVFTGTLRQHALEVPKSIYECSGICVLGRRIKSLVFSTDVAIIKNINADAVIAVYPFTPQPTIMQAIISVSDVPVFVGVGGSVTSGARSVRMAVEAEHQGAYGVVVNAPITADTIKEIKKHVDIPVTATVVSAKQDIDSRIAAGVDILNVAAAAETPNVVQYLRSRYPKIPIIATGGPTDEAIRATIRAGANAVTYTPPTCGDILSEIMRKNRNSY